MASGILNIGIIVPSDLLYEGLTNILLKHVNYLRFWRFDDLEIICSSIPPAEMRIIIADTSLIQNRIKFFRSVKKERPGIFWIGIMHSIINAEALAEFHDIIRIDDNSEFISAKVIRFVEGKNSLGNLQLPIPLSDRELDVLKSLANGFSNKEIADSLNISVHTVISHRKNITQKTGIKSQPGLTIYAITNNIISIDNF